MYHIVAVAPKLRSRVKLTSLYDKTMKRIAEDAIAMVELILLQEKVLAIRKVLLEGDPAKKILEYAENNPIDLLVISSAVSATPPPGIIGSTAKKIISKSSKPVLVYTPLSTTPSDSIRNILLVANKPSEREITKMLDVVSTIAKEFDAYVFAYIIGNKDIASVIKKRLEDLRLNHKIMEPTKENKENIEAEVLELTRNVDLVIINKTKALEEKIPILKYHVSSLCKSLAGLSGSPVIIV